METSFTYNIKKSSVGLSQRSATPAKQHVNTICRLPARVQLQRRLVCSDRLATCKASIIAPGRTLLKQQRRTSRSKVAAPVRAADADAAAGAEAVGNRGPPSLLVRIASAFLYIVPWIDILMIGRQVHHFFPNTIILYLLPGPLAPMYYSGQFVPLIVFFLLFLSIVKNKKLHHFVRFHCMQGVMLDIVSMLFTLIRAYIPAEIRWSYFMDLYDMFAWNICMSIILYCVFFALAGKYADVPGISESVYLQVDASS